MNGPAASTPAGAMFVKALGPLVVINLAHRTDRRREFAAQLSRIGLGLDSEGIRLFPAVRPSEPGGFRSIGARGCFLSHLEVLRTAAAEGLDHIVVCEDDLDFAEDFAARAPDIVATLSATEWDILYAGHHGLPPGLAPDLAGRLARLAPAQKVQTTHFLVFRQRVVAPLIAYLEAILSRPPGHPEGGPMHVDGAFSWFRAAHPDVVTLAALPPLGHQRASRTDIHAPRWFDRLPVVRDLAGLARRIRRPRPAR
jgi:glycosyl transferase family 25